MYITAMSGILKGFLNILLLILLPLICFSQTPTFDRVQQTGSTGSDLVNAIAVDASGNIYATGRFEGTVDFDPGGGVYELTSAGSADLYVLKTDADGNLIWAVRAGSSGNSESGAELAVDASGNVYISCNSSSTFDIDPGAGVFVVSSTGIEDAHVLKLNASGNFVWARTIGGPNTDLVADLALDNAGDLYLAGGFRSTADFDPGPATFNMTAAALYDIFVVKLSSDGAFVWASQATGQGSENAAAIVIDPAGNALVTGDFQVTVDFDPGPGTFTMAPGGGANNIFAWKLNPSGELVWARQMGGPGDDSGYAIATDSDGNAYITGTFQGTADFDPADGTHNLISAGAKDAFVSKLSAAGDFVWAKSIGGSLGDYGFSIQTDAQRNVYSAGYFFGTSDFDPGSDTYNLASNGESDGYVCKLDDSGNFRFAYTFGGTLSDNTLSSVVNGAGDILTAVSFRSTVDFDPGASVAERISAGSSDFAILKITQEASSEPPPVISITTQPADIEVCENDIASLSADASGTSNIIYQWQYFSANSSSFEDMSNGQGYSGVTTNTLTIDPAIGGQPGSYRVRVNGDLAAAVVSNVAVITTVECTINTPPTIGEASLVVQIGGSVSLDLSTILEDTEGNIDLATLQIVVPPSSGAFASIAAGGMLTVNYTNQNFSGFDHLTIRVCDDDDSCTDAEITIEVTGDIVVYNAVSPNGDGLNDILRIEYIEIIEETMSNKVSIFNRWGDKVFEVSDYDNASNVFTGQSDTNTALPSGTYFYTIQYSSGRKSKSGHLLLRR